jgi:branched-chain amino acid transport system substrate-binding protein
MHRNGAMRNAFAWTAIAGVAAIVLAACGSSGSSNPGSSNTGSANPGSGSSGTKTVTIGIIGSKTGPQAPLFSAMAGYVQDRINKANATNEVPGVHFKTAVDDNQSTPAGELTAAHDLVQNKHVFGIIEADALGFSAYRYLVQQKVPVVAPGFDGPEYGDSANRNLFAEEGSSDPHNHSVTTFGTELKGQGVTKLAVIADGDSPAAAATAKVIAASAKNAGIAVPYNAKSVTFATTDFTQVASDIKRAGADGVISEMQSNQNAALVTALKQDDVSTKAIVFSTGYGPDTTDNAALTKVSQGVDFSTVYPPIELQSAATKAFSADLSKYAGVTGDPSFAASTGWFIGDLFMKGMTLAGKNPTPASFITGLRDDTDYNPYGLYSPGLNLTQFGQSTATLAPGNCNWLTKLKGSTFQPINGDEPACGTNIPNSNQT